MNAGAYGGEIKDVILETEFIDYEGNIKKISNAEHEFGYRKSIFTNNKYIVLSSKLQLNNGNKDDIKSIMDKNINARNEKQPINMPSAGSTFKRPEGYFAGKLIEDAGLKGYKIGGAEVSTLHSGFIVNSGGATSKDILDLIGYVQETVKKKFNVVLETEVKIIGED